MQCSPTGSLYKQTESLSVAALDTVMPLLGHRRKSVWMGCCLTFRQFKRVGFWTEPFSAVRVHGELRTMVFFLSGFTRDEQAYSKKTGKQQKLKV